MDRDDIRKCFAKDMEMQDTYDTRQAKQRASIKWLLSKAYNNRVPENLKEPFYKDHEDQERVKPPIVHNLANAELYCLAFANIYSDPNYHNLNHGGILQTLARKGIPAPDCGDGPLTETVLIKTAPLKLAAHIAMIEAIMELYSNEVATPDRVVAAVQRFTHGAVSPALPVTAEEGLLLWVNQAQAALARRIALETAQDPPRFPPIREMQSLSDGAGLAALISFYCPEELPWQDIKVSALPTVSDSVHNLCLVHEFSHHSLPASVCHMMPEDVTYLRGNMRMNLVALMADLFNVLEIHPVKCVRFPGREPSAERNSQGVAHKRSLPQPITCIPDLRSHLSSHTSFTVTRNSASAGIRKSHSSPYTESFAGSPDSLDTRQLDERDYVVHRGRVVPTLSSVLSEEVRRSGGREKSVVEEEVGRAAGKPSHWDESKRPSYAGRRSRRNSLTEDSQLTLENFGGSQENLHFLGRNPDKDPAILVTAAASAAIATRTSAQEARSTGVELIFAHDDRSSSPVLRRKSPSPAPAVNHTPSVPIRSSQQDARSNAIDRIFADNGYGIEKPVPVPVSAPSVSNNGNNVSLNHVLHHSRQEEWPDGDISGIAPLDKLNNSQTTTWQQQQRTSNTPPPSGLQQVPNTPDEHSSNLQLMNIRMKLEEKRRMIENEKKRMELVVNKQRQKMGKAAFLQAVTKDMREGGEGDGQWLVEDQLARTYSQHLASEPRNDTLSPEIAKLRLNDSDSPRKQKLQNFAIQISGNQNNQTFTTFAASSSPPTKPLSLSQLHHQTTQQQSPLHNNSQFFLHDQPRRTTWREQTDQNPMESASSPGLGTSGLLSTTNRINGTPSQTPTPSPRMTQVRPPPPTMDDMAPQSICFIGDEDDSQARARIQISSGSRTYRIPSPTRTYAKNPFLHKPPPQEPEPEKGFYISFDDEAPPKRPKPPLRGKRNSPKKDRFATQIIDTPFEERDERSSPPQPMARPRANQTTVPSASSERPSRSRSPDYQQHTFSTPFSPDSGVGSIKTSDRILFSPDVAQRPAVRPSEPMSPGVGLVIGSEPDANAVDEMERKKEKILLLSLQRRQQQEELKARKEMEAHQRRESEKLKEEERARKKEEDKVRRAAILEQFKLKKAIEEAEREGKVVDKEALLKLAAPKMRGKPTTTPRPRPKTIHVERGSVDGAMLGPSRGPRGSSSNLADRSHENSVFSRPLRRDHYRGSQDSLTTATRGRARESPCDDDRGTSPSRSSISNLGRRGSYKTSRGSSADQDSLAYRYGDTDSGLGRATPPRRAPSPGFNRHLTSPSGPGSLPPGLISKRRGFDDGASDVSSNASSMLEYSGPRLYKQPASKSNRGIMLNAVEYCVFPGAVNKEAKRRVLEEISRSEAKHFLILFRDAGCQFRALYSYCPDTEDVIKLYGTGPKQVNERMFDRFFKYNSSGKCFSQIHTKHLTVTIDAFTIHNSLWQGKKVNLPSKKDMALVI